MANRPSLPGYILLSSLATTALIWLPLAVVTRTNPVVLFSVALIVLVFTAVQLFAANALIREWLVYAEEEDVTAASTRIEPSD